jgi:hypothetical protein
MVESFCSTRLTFPYVVVFILICVDSKHVTHKMPWQHSGTSNSDNIDSTNPVKVVDVIEVPVQWIPLQRVLRDIDVLCCP